MNYFTPELIVMGRSDDDDTLDEQDRLWDEACANYSAYLAGIRTHLPEGLRKLKENYYLHDAAIRGMGQQRGLFVLMLQLDTPPRTLLTFEYDLVESEIRRDALPESARSRGSQIDWQYDEIEMVAGDPPTWRQSILLNNGWEVRLHFRDVRVVEVLPLIPALAATATSLGAVPVTVS